MAFHLNLGAVSAGRLSLRGRSLTEVPASALTPTINALDVSDNLLGSENTPPKLPELPELVELRMADNVLDAKTLQRASPLPANLRVLDISANRLTLLPPCVLRLSLLITLKVDRQRLRVLPPELYLLSELVELDAGFNELTSALVLTAPGLPRLRRLVLRSNGLASDSIKLDPDTLPRLTELDLAGNALATWPVDVGKLDGLHRLILANNRLHTLVSSETVAHKRMWVPTAGLHMLPQLVELSLAQNALAELPTALNQLRALRRLDVRCNPLSTSAASLAATHCEGIGATLLSSAMRPLGQGLLLGDDSSAWHKPTLLRAHVKYILSVGGTPRAGMRAHRLAAKLPEEYRLLGLPPPTPPTPTAPSPASAPAPSAPDAPPADAPPADAPEAGVVTAHMLRRAFHAAALKDHPDKQPDTADDHAKTAAADRFNRVQEAYRATSRAVAMERRRLPELEGFVYHFVDMPNSLLAAVANAEASAEAGAEGSAAALAAASAALGDAFRTERPGLLAFAREARGKSDGALLVHMAGGTAPAHAALLAILLDSPTASLSPVAAAAALAPALGMRTDQLLRDLPAALVDELHALARDRLRASVHVERDEDAHEVQHVPVGTAAANARAAAEVSTDMAVRRNPEGRYDPVLSIADPMAMPSAAPPPPSAAPPPPSTEFHAAPDNAPRHPSVARRGKKYSPNLSFSDTISDPLGGLDHMLSAVEISDPTAPPAAAPARRPRATASGASSISFGTDDDEGSSSFSVGGSEEIVPGWSVDELGRKVLTLPPGAPKFQRVVVEYEEGARVQSGDDKSATSSFIG